MEFNKKLAIVLALLVIVAVVVILILNQTGKKIPVPEPTTTVEPTTEPTTTVEPTAEPTATVEPTAEPTVQPTSTVEPSTEPTVSSEVGKVENFFASLKLTYLDGTPFDTSVFEGKPIFINIWATWCPPCVAEMPVLDELAKEYAGKITIIGLHAEGLTVDEAQGIVPNKETNQAALELAGKLGLTYPVLNPDNTLFSLMNNPEYGLQVEVLPTTWLVDGEGYIREILTGSRDKAGWTEVIDGFLLKLEEEKNAGGGN
jgi:thiol-disulfide isomerase/thioredoxin